MTSLNGIQRFGKWTRLFACAFGVMLVGCQQGQAQDTKVIAEENNTSESSEVVKYKTRYFRQELLLSKAYSPPNSATKTFGLQSFYQDIRPGGVLIEGFVGYKNGNLPTYATPGWSLEDVDKNATFFEVYIDDKKHLKLSRKLFGKRIAERQVSAECFVEERMRRGERVVVVVRTPKSNDKIAWECAVYSHLYYFGLTSLEMSDLHDFVRPQKEKYDLWDFRFDIEKIRLALEKQSEELAK